LPPTNTAIEQTAPPRSGVATDPARHTAIFCLLLVAVTLVSYNSIERNHFIEFDDANYIVKNSHVQAGFAWNTLVWSFTTFREGNWHPLTWLSHALDYQLFHLNPAGHHYTNLILHAANAVLLFLLLIRATEAPWTSWFVAALFALHPINVESVAWAAERKNVLSMLFFLLALTVYDRHARTEPGREPVRLRASPRSTRSLLLWCAVVTFFALGLMAKAQIVTLPFVLLLWDYWPLGRLAADQSSRAADSAVTPQSFWTLVWEKWPLFALAAADSVITVVAQRTGNALRTISQVALPARLENAFVSYARYLGKAVWPSRLAPLYPHPGNSLPLWQVAASIFLLLAISAFVLYERDRRYLVVGWFWFLGTLIPMIGIITVGDQAMADRYAYLSFIGLFIAVVWGARDVARRYELKPVWLAVPASVVLCTFGMLTHRQLGHWFDEETLWRYTLSVTEKNYVAHNNLALALANSGRPDEAIEHFHAASALHQYPADQIVKLALYELRLGYPARAVEDCKAGLDASPTPQVQEAAFTEMGAAFLQLRKYYQAEKSYREVLRLRPDNSDALVGIGLLALRSGDSNLAVASFSHAAKIDPSDVNFLLLAESLRQSGQLPAAGQAVAQAQQVTLNLAQSQQAVAQFLALVDLKPM
jgi:protein O-mannosyl-transferase